MTKVHGKRYAYKFDFQGLAAATQPASDPAYKYQSDLFMTPYHHGSKLTSFMNPHHGMSSSSGEFGTYAMAHNYLIRSPVLHSRFANVNKRSQLQRHPNRIDFSVGRVVGQLGQPNVEPLSAAFDVARDTVACGTAPGLVSALRMTITVRWWILIRTASNVGRCQSECARCSHADGRLTCSTRHCAAVGQVQHAVDYHCIYNI